MTARATFIAFNRFGSGARPNDWWATKNDPLGWLYDQLAGVPDSLPRGLARNPKRVPHAVERASGPPTQPLSS